MHTVVTTNKQTNSTLPYINANNFILIISTHLFSTRLRRQLYLDLSLIMAPSSALFFFCVFLNLLLLSTHVAHDVGYFFSPQGAIKQSDHSDSGNLLILIPVR